MFDLRIASLCLGSDAIGINGRHSLAKFLFTEHVFNISTMGSFACAKRKNIRSRIICCLWYMMRRRSWLRRKHQSGVQNWRCCSFAFACCRRRGLLRAPDFSTFPRLALGRIDAEFTFRFSTFPRPVLGRIDAEAALRLYRPAFAGSGNRSRFRF